MSYLLYLAGLIIGISLFLYLLSTFNSARDRINKMTKNAPPPKASPELEPKNISYKKYSAAAGTRICPLCSKGLTRLEPLYASFIETEYGKKILIYGCPYCYKPEKEKAILKKRDLK